MSDDLDMVKVLGNYRIYRQVCSAVFYAVETSELRVELGLVEKPNDDGEQNGGGVAHVKSEPKSTLKDLMTELKSMTQHEDPVHRCAAAKALGAAALCSETLVSEAEASLISLMSHADEGTSVAAIDALGGMATKGTPRLVEALIRQLANARLQSYRVTSEILVALQHCNPLVASQAVPTLIGIIRQLTDAPPNSDLLISEILVALQRCDPLAASQAESCLTAILAKGEIATELQVDICETLGGFGSGALMAVETLLKILPTEAAKSKNLRKGPERIRKSKKVPISTTADPTLVRAAVVAIAKIDPNGSQVMKSVRTIDELEQLRIGLHSFGDTSVRPLIEQLTQHVAELKVRPPAGRERRQMKELVEIIFGPGPSVEPENEKSEQEAKRWNNSREGNIADWLAAKKLRGMRVAHGSYDVETGDLERLKQIYRGREPSDDH